MRSTLSALQRISDSLERIGEDMQTEEQVYKAELEDRQAKGLTGDDAIKHYNEWMIKAGMKHLTV
jgi:hypothetical protein